MVNAWSDNDYKPIPPDRGILSNVWVLNGDDLIRAGIVNGRAPNLIVRQLMIYDRSGGILQRVIRAGRAIPLPGSRGWLLDDVRIYDANMNLVRHLPRMTGLQGVTPGAADHRQGRPDRARLLDLEAPHRRARGCRPPGR